jgi:nicotinate-nucleotide pyrophosphorylase (carboxylating)
MNPVIAAALAAAGLDASDVADLVLRTIAEDLDGGVDVTSEATVPADQQSILELVAREDGTTAGVWVAAAAFDLYTDGLTTVTVHVEDGTDVVAGTCLLTATGRTRDLLVCERTALNFYSQLSGVATATRAWSTALAGTGAHVRDTRKTTPLLRALEKYAVRCGGGVNHRMSLRDAALVKDNHIVAAGGVRAAFEAVRSTFPGVPVEVEVDNLAQLRDVLDAGADLVLLDNFSLDQLREAVAITAGRAQLEASGGLTLADAHAVGATGVNFLAVGALTHSARVMDIGADLRSA